jgi:hypothetical protein
MTTTVIKIRKFEKHFNKKILKNREKGQLLSDVRKMIHLFIGFREDFFKSLQMDDGRQMMERIHLKVNS